MNHPSGLFHLAILSRRNPPLSLASLRARSMMTEVRMQDLQFKKAETAAFLEQAVGHRIEDATLTRLQDRTEGWPVGLRLAGLALRHRRDEDKLYISPGTVKSHTKNIYGKLAVGSHRDAVAKAVGMGILAR